MTFQNIPNTHKRAFRRSIVTVGCGILAVGSALSFAADDIVSGGVEDSATAFIADSNPDDIVIYDEPEDAQKIVSLALPNRGGTLTFYDEAPSASKPSLSIVVVEKRRNATLDAIMRQKASPLEVFNAFAPRGMRVPPRILAHEDTRPDHESPVLMANQSIFYPGPLDLPTVEPDDWGGCESFEDWELGFNMWVNRPDALVDHALVEIGTNDAPNTWYGEFGTNDNIWVGVCVQSALFMQVRMQYRDQWGNWQPVGGNTLPTAENVDEGERYLYHSFKPYTSARRVKVNSIGESYKGNFAIISGAWTDDFAPDDQVQTP